MKADWPAGYRTGAHSLNENKQIILMSNKTTKLLKVSKITQIEVFYSWFRVKIDTSLIDLGKFFHIVSHMGITLTNVGSIVNGFYIPREEIYRPRPSASVCKFFPPWDVKSIDNLASIRQWHIVKTLLRNFKKASFIIINAISRRETLESRRTYFHVTQKVTTML